MSKFKNMTTEEFIEYHKQEQLKKNKVIEEWYSSSFFRNIKAIMESQNNVFSNLVIESKKPPYAGSFFEYLNKDISLNLRRLMKINKLSNKDIENLLNIESSVLSKLLNAKLPNKKSVTFIQDYYIKDFSKIFKTPISNILFGIENVNDEEAIYNYVFKIFLIISLGVDEIYFEKKSNIYPNPNYRFEDEKEIWGLFDCVKIQLNYNGNLKKFHELINFSPVIIEACSCFGIFSYLRRFWNLENKLIKLDSFEDIWGFENKRYINLYFICLVYFWGILNDQFIETFISRVLNDENTIHFYYKNLMDWLTIDVMNIIVNFYTKQDKSPLWKIGYDISEELFLLNKRRENIGEKFLNEKNIFRDTLDNSLNIVNFVQIAKIILGINNYSNLDILHQSILDMNLIEYMIKTEHYRTLVQIQLEGLNSEYEIIEYLGALKYGDFKGLERINIISKIFKIES